MFPLPNVRKDAQGIPGRPEMTEITSWLTAPLGTINKHLIKSPLVISEGSGAEPTPQRATHNFVGLLRCVANSDVAPVPLKEKPD